MKIPLLFAIASVLSGCAFAQQTPVTDVQPLPAAAEKPLPTLWIIGDSTVKNGTKGRWVGADYAARLSLAMSCGRETARVAVVYPTESMWSREQNVRSGSVFAPREYNGADKIAARVADYFQTGKDVLALKIENVLAPGSLLKPLHLSGDFALVGAQRRVLAPLPAAARFRFGRRRIAALQRRGGL